MNILKSLSKAKKISASHLQRNLHPKLHSTLPSSPSSPSSKTLSRSDFDKTLSQAKASPNTSFSLNNFEVIYFPSRVNEEFLLYDPSRPKNGVRFPQSESEYIYEEFFI